MTAPKLIGMVGKAQSGKDTFANVLVREGWYVRLAFADGLKRDVADFIGISVTELEERKDEFRATLQAYGSSGRQRDAAYWINRLKYLLVRVPDGTGVIITDVRYRNEAEFIHGQGGVLVRRVRGDGEKLGGIQAQHSSETELEKIFVDYTCTCGTVPEIQEHARKFLEEPRGEL